MIHHGAPCTSKPEPLICHTFRSYCISVCWDTFSHSLSHSTSCGCCLLRMFSRTGHISLPSRSVDALDSTTQSALSLPQSTLFSCEILPNNRSWHNRSVSSGACVRRHCSSPVLDFAPHCQLSREDHEEGQKRAMALAKNPEEVFTRSR